MTSSQFFFRNNDESNPIRLLPEKWKSYTLVLLLQWFSIAFGQPNFPAEDSLNSLKKKAAQAFSSGDFKASSKALRTISDRYLRLGDTLMSLDYLNKSLSSAMKDPERNLADDFHSLLVQYNAFSSHNLTLSTAIATNCLNYHKKFRNTANTIILDFILDSSHFEMDPTIKLQLHRQRISEIDELGRFEEKVNLIWSLMEGSEDVKHDYFILKDLAESYSKIMDYNMSNYVLYAMLSLQSLTTSQTASIYNLLGNNYLLKKDLNLASHYYYLSINLRKQLPDNEDQLRVIFNNLSNYHKEAGNLDSCLIYLNKSLELALSRFGENSRETAFAYNNIGNYYFSIDEYENALKNFEVSLNIKENLEDFSNVDLVNSYYNIAFSYIRQGYLDVGLEFINKKLINKKIYKINFEQIRPLQYLAITELVSDAFYQKFCRSANTIYLDSAVHYNFESIGIMDSLIQYGGSENSLLLINQSLRSRLEKSFTFYIASRNELNSLNISDTVIIKLADRCHKQILFKNYYNGKYSKSNDIIKLLCNNNLEFQALFKIIDDFENGKTDLNIDSISILCKKIIDRFSTVNFSSNELAAKRSIEPYELDIGKLQSKLENKSAILEYSIINDSVFCSLILKENTRFYKLSDKTILNDIGTIINGINKLSLDAIRLKEVSSILLRPLLDTEHDLEKIIIIPDVGLEGFPFDLLLTHDKQRNLKYLISLYDISYSYSLSYILDSFHEIDRYYDYDYIGFGVNSFSTNYPELINAVPEVNIIRDKFISQGFKAISLTNEDANLSNFNRYANSTSILHLSTHLDFSNNNRPSLILSNKKTIDNDNNIRYSDLNTLVNAPFLVILSTCNSNMGETYQGEGRLNFCRALAINGTQYVVFTFFDLDDSFSYTFMNKFYENILNGIPLVKALSQVKREIMNTGKYSHPLYWSNYGVLGI